MYDDELEHYGRLGMKWGQHIFGKEKAYGYAVKKLRKMDRKIQKSQTKEAKYRLLAAKNREKASRPFSGIGMSWDRSSIAAKQERISAKAGLRMVKTTRKAKKWATSMNAVFGDIELSSISPEDVALGRQYAVKAIEDYLKKS